MNLPFGLSQLRAGIYAGAAVLFLAVLGFAGCEHQRANAAVAEREQIQVSLDGVAKSNEALQATVDMQSKALDDWAKTGVTPAEVIQMIRDRNQYAADLAAARAENAGLKEKDRELPECAALLRTDFQRVCPGRARVLRDNEVRTSPRPAGGSSGPGVRPAG